MQELIRTAPTTHSSVHVRLILESFDSADECSFQHWLNVCKLVDEGEDRELNDTELVAELVPAAWN